RRRQARWRGPRPQGQAGRPILAPGRATAPAARRRRRTRPVGGTSLACPCAPSIAIAAAQTSDPVCSPLGTWAWLPLRGWGAVQRSAWEPAADKSPLRDMQAAEELIELAESRRNRSVAGRQREKAGDEPG